MKRSFFDSSFVTENSNDNAPTRPRSLHRRTATPATHPFYVPQDIPAQDYYLEQSLLTPGRCLLDDGERDADFQSNVWFQPTSGSTHFWSRITPGRRPLTGLGITFGSPEVPTTAPYLLASPPVLAPFLRSSAPSPEGAPAVARDNPSRTCGVEYAGVERGDTQTAYSNCPSADFMAHSPSSAPGIPYSPADDFLMLVDAPDVAEPSIDKGKGKELNAELDFSMLSMDSPESPVIGLFADVNYRALSARKSPVLGVNPADVTGEGNELIIFSSNIEDKEDNVLMDDIGPLLSLAEYDDSPQLQVDFPEDALSAIVSVLAESTNQGQPAPCQLPVNAVFRLVRPPAHSLAMQPPAYASRTIAVSKTASSSVIGKPLSLPVRSPLAPVQPRNLTDQSPGPTQRPATVPNANKGVDLEVLRSSADTFRRLNPGCELDKTFLQAFAGRLSEHGELLPEFRCYVKGCTQTNKRRDHILVHVGSHVEHRPFQCDECGMRFLRKNECKRHMSSHIGVKPYACSICAPYQEKSFVRQDLLKRHMKVTHGSTQWPDGRRKRAKLTEPQTPTPRVEEDRMSLDQ